MKEAILFVIILAVGFNFYTNRNVTKNVLIDNFEGKIAVDTTDFGSSPNSWIKATGSSQQLKCGLKSLQIDYNLAPGGYVYCARGHDIYKRTDSSSWKKGNSGWEIKPDDIDWSTFDGISFYIRGDSLSPIAIDIKDTYDQLWRFTIRKKLQGWEKITIPFEEFKTRTDWQPPKARRNNKMDFPIKTFQIEPKKQGTGTLYIDCLKAVTITEN